MAGKNITIAGATFNGVPSIDVPISGGGTASFVEISDTTAQASDVAQGKFFYDAQGVKTEGSASGGGGVDVEALSVTQNGTYTAPTGKAYSPVTVNVSGGGGGSSWTKVCEKTVNVSTTSTTLATEIWETGHSEIWAVSKYILVRIRDTAGKRNSHFYGSDNFFVLPQLAFTTNTQKGLRYIHRVSSIGRYSQYENVDANGYGVYADMVYNNGDVRLCWRYNSNYSLTIDGEFKVEVYILDPPAPIYE